MTDHSSPEKSSSGWKALIIFCILGALFLGFFYLAVSNDADYMPSQQHKENTQQHAFKTAPAMSQEALQKAKEDQAKRDALPQYNTADMQNMSESEHTQMTYDDASSSAHGH